MDISTFLGPGTVPDKEKAWWDISTFLGAMTVLDKEKPDGHLVISGAGTVPDKEKPDGTFQHF